MDFNGALELERAWAPSAASRLDPGDPEEPEQ